MITTLIVPGLDGSPAPHWQDWWVATDPTALMVDLSDPSTPVPAVQEIELASMILQHRDCVLVGHSLGAVLIARLLAHYPHLPVAAVMLVAPAEPQGADRIGHFGPIPEQPFDVPATVVASRNDPWMSFARAAQLARAWDADFVDLGMAGHINVASGYGPWPEGKLLRDDLLAQAHRGSSLPVFDAMDVAGAQDVVQPKAAIYREGLKARGLPQLRLRLLEQSLGAMRSLGEAAGAFRAWR